MKNCVFILMSWLTWHTGMGQHVVVDQGPLYTHDEIPRVHINIHPDSLAELYLEENWYENHEYQAQFVFQSILGADTLEDIGLRFRGNTSRDKDKKSFKISFNTYVSGRQYHDVEKMNLNAETNDHSMVRSFSGWNLYHDLNIAAPRSNHVELYVNGEYYGLYQNAEQIDEEFTDKWFGSKVGNLYKCRYPANLDFISSNPDAYKVAPWGDRTYELKTNTEEDNYAGLSQFIQFLNQSGEIDFQCNYSEYFNVHAYLKTTVVDILTGNWDGYIYNQNNFYLYDNPLTGQFEYIPFDIDNTWGIDWLDRNWANRNIYSWDQGGAERPLYERLMDNDVYRDIFSWHMQNALNELYGTPAHEAEIENVHDFISESALSDPYRPLDFGYDEDDFLNALVEGYGWHVDYGVLEFVAERKENAENQLESVSIAPIIYQVKEDFELLPDVFVVEVFVEGPDVLEAELNFSLNGVQQESETHTGSAESYAFEIEVANVEELTYNISMLGTNGMSRQAYCETRVIEFEQNPRLVLNEVMTSNTTTIQDEAGEYDDWIELYNTSDGGVNLSGVYLTDNNAAPLKWAAPGIIMASNTHRLFWADKDLHQGNNHTNFKLSSTGENLYLMRKIENGLRVLDYVSIPPLGADLSYGRSTDGAVEWMLFSSSTPNWSNGEPNNVQSADVNPLGLHPNPTYDLVYFRQPSLYLVKDFSGRIVASGNGKSVDLSHLAEGVYVVEVEGVKAKIVKLSR